MLLNTVQLNAVEFPLHQRQLLIVIGIANVLGILKWRYTKNCIAKKSVTLGQCLNSDIRQASYIVKFPAIVAPNVVITRPWFGCKNFRQLAEFTPKLLIPTFFSINQTTAIYYFSRNIIHQRPGTAAFRWWEFE
ncbi:hypothetical protein BK661_19950 [Pseudomonas frederiksbergensis]|uniref:Uncharacterized protein n=1 Tax=Pseudomonas frederiksbergensis TaxID=104087 RepID=A0A423IZD0_9PSED|nr:hypothetical protein BK661_19950 [Pseudomonas frederiksbergensis]